MIYPTSKAFKVRSAPKSFLPRIQRERQTASMSLHQCLRKTLIKALVDLDDSTHSRSDGSVHVVEAK